MIWSLCWSNKPISKYNKQDNPKKLIIAIKLIRKGLERKAGGIIQTLYKSSEVINLTILVNVMSQTDKTEHSNHKNSKNSTLGIH